MKPLFTLLPLLSLSLSAFAAGPQYLDDQFELPPGFRIYRAAGPELTGGSYAMTFDGEGRLLIGDGTAARRLIDKDQDGVYDGSEIIATNLGGRGPQGLLVEGDRLYAVGDDGLQLFDGYRSGGPLVHRGRLGAKFHTGGDHDAHTILRGHDGWIYFMTGNGSGNEKRVHITETNSAAMFEREATVYRLTPDGARWEAVAVGGRNPPSLGMNYLGDLFSFDSDMEWHVGLPWYRPVRLNHWTIGGDEGWQDVGAYPPWFLDGLPGVLNIGRGSPTWGTMYEHHQFPASYLNAFLVCDYRWKSATHGNYGADATGRLVAFHLQREGAGWKAVMEQMVKPRPGARDADGKPIDFALVDVQVAPDGSLVISDHNQGVWRLVYDPAKAGDLPTPEAAARQMPVTASRTAPELVDDLLALPQPSAEWCQRRADVIRTALGSNYETLLKQVALDDRQLPAKRLRAIRVLAPEYAQLPAGFLRSLTRDRNPEIRGFGAWLEGIRGGPDAAPRLVKLLNDRDPMVRRRAAEGLNRTATQASTKALTEHLADPVPLVRYVAMTALAHRPESEWLEKAVAQREPQIRLRALAATTIRREPPADDLVRRVVETLLREETSPELLPMRHPQNELDVLRILGLFKKPLAADPAVLDLLANSEFSSFPPSNPALRWEQIRILGEYQVPGAFPKLLTELEAEPVEVTQYHLAQALSRYTNGWTGSEEARLTDWFLASQRGWFAEFESKGVQFPDFWSTTLHEFAGHHREALLRDPFRLQPESQLGRIGVDLLAERPNAGETLVALYRAKTKPAARLRLVRALRKVQGPEVSALLRDEFAKTSDAGVQNELLLSLAAQPASPENLPVLLAGFLKLDNHDVLRACASRLAQSRAEVAPLLQGAQLEPLAHACISRLDRQPPLFQAMDQLLAAVTGAEHPALQPKPGGKADDAAARVAALDFWRSWYAQRFGQAFQDTPAAVVVEKSDDEILKFLLSEDFRKGDARHGLQVYETAQCYTCHGGVTPGKEGRIFGPDLVGVTRRLNRQDLADSIVYPSKQVADRYKAFEVTLKDGESVTGFLTEKTDETVTIAALDQVTRIPRSKVESIQLQAKSLMPEHLLSRLTWTEMSDLLAFLDQRPAAK